MPETILFADGLLEVSVHFGVARMTLAQAGPDNKAVRAGQLVMPVTQLPAFAGALVKVLRQIEEKAKEAQAQQNAALASPPVVEEGVPGSFRFGS